MNKPVLYYVYDPMCSWCWGYSPVWLTLQKQLKSIVNIHYIVGGLAEDSNEPMSDDMQIFLQKTWQKISLEWEHSLIMISGLFVNQDVLPILRAVQQYTHEKTI